MLTLALIIQANESEIPLLHEFNGVVKENGTSIEVGIQSWRTVHLFFFLQLKFMYFISFVELNDSFHLTILGGATPVVCGDDSS